MNAHERSRQLAAMAIDFELTAAERRELNAHLAACDSCRGFERAVRLDGAGLRSIATEPAPAQVRAALARVASSSARSDPLLTLERVRKAQAWPGPFPGAIRLAIVLALVAALLFGLALSGLLVGQRRLADLPGPTATTRLPVPSAPAAGQTVRAMRPAIPICPDSGGLRAAPSAVWVLCDQAVWRVDIRNGQVTARVSGVGDVAVGPAGAWAVASQTTVQLDPQSGAVLSRVPNAGGSAIAVGEGAVWVVDTPSGTVTKIDPVKRRVVGTLRVGGVPIGIAVGGGAVWIAGRTSDTVTRIDPLTDRAVATIPVGHGPLSMAFAAGALWVANNGDGTVSRIDPVTNTVRSSDIDSGSSPDTSVLPALAAQSDRWLWIIDAHAAPPGVGDSPSELARIDGSGQSAGPTKVAVAGLDANGAPGGAPDELTSVAVVDGGLWVADIGNQLFAVGP